MSLLSTVKLSNKISWKRILSITGIIAFLVVLTVVPEHRIIVKDGFASQKIAAKLRKMSSLPMFRASRRQEVKLIPSVNQRRKSITPIEPDSLIPYKTLGDATYYLETASLTIVPALLFAAIPSPKVVTLIIIMLLFTLALGFAKFLSLKEPITLFMLIVFNPPVLFFIYHCASIDSYSLVASGTFFLGSFAFLQIQRANVLRRDFISAFFLGMSLIVATFGNPIILFCPIVCLGVHLLTDGLNKCRAVYYIAMFLAMGAMLLFYVLWANFLGLNVEQVITSHPLLNGENLSSPYIRGTALLEAHQQVRLSKGYAIFVVIRTLILAFPMLVLFLPAMSQTFSSLSKQVKYHITSVVLTIIGWTILIVPLDLSHYILASRALLPITILAALPISLWLQSRHRLERIVYVITIVITGLAGYTFFMARLRLDPLHLQVISALDQNYDRMYLIFKLF